jgi:hypothetical protein
MMVATLNPITARATTRGTFCGAILSRWAEQKLLDPRLEVGQGIAGLSQLGDGEADCEQELLAGTEEYGEDLLVVASTPDDRVEGAPVDPVVSAVNHAFPRFLLRRPRGCHLSRRVGEAWRTARGCQPQSEASPGDELSGRAPGGRLASSHKVSIPRQLPVG